MKKSSSNSNISSSEVPPLCSNCGIPGSFEDGQFDLPNHLCGLEFPISNPFAKRGDAGDKMTSEKHHEEKKDERRMKNDSVDDGEEEEDLDKALADIDIPSDVDQEFDEEEEAEELIAINNVGIWDSFRQALLGHGGDDVTGKEKKPIVEEADNDDNDGHDDQENSCGDEPDKTKAYSSILQRPFAEREEESMGAWTNRLQREEVFSLRYRPNEEESDELDELASYLGLERKDSLASRTPQNQKRPTQSTPSPGSFWGLRSPLAVGIAGTGVDREGGEDYTSLTQLLVPDTSQKQPHSIILRRGPVMFKIEGKSKVQAKEAEESEEPEDENHEHCEYELVLLTHGFILVKASAGRVTDQVDFSTSLSNLMGISSAKASRKYETCKLWDMVSHIEDSTTYDPTGSANWRFAIALTKDGGNEERFEFVAGSRLAKDAWLAAVGHILVEHTLHDPNQRSVTESLGWQHTLVHRPGFTAAVTRNLDHLDRLLVLATAPTLSENDDNSGSTKEQLNTLDSYNQMSPLHYAIQHDPIDKEVIKALLQAGADPNLPDGENRSSMYYAERNQLDDEIKELLKSYGATKSQLTETEARGELFGGIEEASRKTAHRRKIDKAVKENKAAEAAKKAESAQSAMGDAMNALRDRGEKIEEMSEKANELLAGAQNYGDMAKQLKESVKKKRWYSRSN